MCVRVMLQEYFMVSMWYYKKYISAALVHMHVAVRVSAHIHRKPGSAIVECIASHAQWRRHKHLKLPVPNYTLHYVISQVF